MAAAVMAIALGIFGIHKFYLRKPFLGVLYLVFCWTSIPALIGLVEGLIYATMDQEKWNEKHNQGISFGRESGGVIAAVAVAFVIVTLLGIIAAIALPAYQDYTIRARMSDPISRLALVKTAVSEYATARQTWPESTAEINYAFDDPAELSGISIEDGVIYAIYADVKAATGIEGSIYIAPTVHEDGTISWSCGSVDIEPRYLPATCR